VSAPEMQETPRHERSFRRRVIGLLAFIYDGIHHVKGQNIRWTEGPFPHATLSVADNLATYDWDGLTRLVIGAHDLALRVGIRASGPRHVKIVIHPRRRPAEGDGVWQRHPVLEDHVRLLRAKCEHWMDEERGS